MLLRANRVRSRVKGHILYTLNYLHKYYQFSKILKGLLIYGYKQFISLSMDITKEHIINVNDCLLSTIPNDRGISTELLIFGTHEPITTKLLKKELVKGMVCLDIGSNIGYYALLERKLVEDEGKVIAIEPSPLNVSYLKNNINRNGFTNIETFNFALSSSDCEVRFLMDAKSNLSKVVNENDYCLGGSVIRVPARSLDSFSEQYSFDKLDFLRMDVEGHEMEIFRGGSRTIERFKPALLIECHTLNMLKGMVDLLRSLQSIGYDVKYFIPRELDNPLLGSVNDVQQIGIAQLIEKLIEGLLPDYFHLFLVNIDSSYM